MEVYDVAEKDNDVLKKIEQKICQRSEMQKSEREFLNSLILKHKPKKIVEIGVAAGSSSVLILNAIKNDENSHLFSLDYFKSYYRDNTKNTGYIVDNFPDLKTKWTLITKGMSCNSLDEIGGNIDFCLLDTVHSNPGEFLDYLQILPYMKDDGVIVIHDTSLSTITNNLAQTTCGVLFSVINGEKSVPAKTEHPYFPNIGAVVLNKSAKKEYFDVFNCLILPWTNQLSEKDISELKKHFSKHYDNWALDFFDKVLEYQKNLAHNKLRPDLTSYKPPKKNFLRKIKQLLPILEL